jgi:hypothetical protein
LGHVADEWFDEIKAMVLLFHTAQYDFFLMNSVRKPGYSPPELSFQDSIRQLGMDDKASFGRGAQVPACGGYRGVDQEEAH